MLVVAQQAALWHTIDFTPFELHSQLTDITKSTLKLDKKPTLECDTQVPQHKKVIEVDVWKILILVLLLGIKCQHNWRGLSNSKGLNYVWSISSLRLMHKRWDIISMSNWVFISMPIDEEIAHCCNDVVLFQNGKSDEQKVYCTSQHLLISLSKSFIIHFKVHFMEFTILVRASSTRNEFQRTI